MAKWAIVSKTSGALSDICDEADKFEIYEGADAELKWCEVPDDTTYEHAMINGVVVHRSENEDLREDAVVERILGYGDQGEQMDMLYRDIAAGKNLDAADAEWYNHVKNVKDTVTKPSTIAAFVQDPKKVQLEGRDAWDPWVDNWVP